MIQPDPGTDARLPATLSPLPEHRFGYDEARHLLWRAGFGGTPSQIQTLASWGLDRAVDYLLEPEKIAFEPVRSDAFDADIMRPPSAEERMAYRRAQQSRNEDALARFRLERQRRQRSDRQQIRQMQIWWLTRMIETPRPLEEKMTLFWHGHFATSYRKVEDSYHMFQQNQLFRSEAIGNYGTLLGAIIRDPGMIRYLDNDRSRRGQPNENLARELMELFSLGEGNYTERDIKEGARALTGYTFNDNAFEFQDRNHDTGSKTILGVRGPHDGEDFVRAILAQRACGRFMAAKLYRFFVADLPDDPNDADSATRRVVNEMAGGLAGANYELKPVLRRLFRSEHFYHHSVRLEQIKSPVQLVVGAIRSLLTPVRDMSILVDALGLMGQSVFLPPSVKGWDGGRAWISTSTVFVRQNILSFLLTGKTPQGYDPSARTDPYSPEALLSELGSAGASERNETDRVVDYLLRFTLGRVPPRAKMTLTRFIDGHGGPGSDDVITGALLLISAMPEYQLC